MWYFAWMLGIGFATGAGILNAVWHELHLPEETIRLTRFAPRGDVKSPWGRLPLNGSGPARVRADTTASAGSSMASARRSTRPPLDGADEGGPGPKCEIRWTRRRGPEGLALPRVCV